MSIREKRRKRARFRFYFEKSFLFLDFYQNCSSSDLERCDFCFAYINSYAQFHKTVSVQRLLTSTNPPLSVSVFLSHSLCHSPLLHLHSVYFSVSLCYSYHFSSHFDVSTTNHCFCLFYSLLSGVDLSSLWNP